MASLDNSYDPAKKRSRGMSLLIILLAALAVFAVAFPIAGGYVTVHPGILQPFVKWPPSTPSDHGVPYEAFEVTAPDGVTLRGWWMAATATPVRGTIIGLHGVASPKTDWASFAGMICPRGYNLVLYDSRGHGESDWTAVTYGEKERTDVNVVLDALAARGYPTKRVILMGTSMGGSVALLAAADNPRVEAVVAQSAFTSYPDVFLDQSAALIGPLAGPVRSVVFFWARLWSGGDAFMTASALAAARRITQPVLIVHGTGDWLVPPTHAGRLYEAVVSTDKTLLMVEDGTHESMWHGDFPEYRRTLYAFLDRVTEPAVSESLPAPLSPTLSSATTSAPAE